MDFKSATPPPPTRDPRTVTPRHTPEPTKSEARKAWWSTKGKHWADKAQGWSDNIGGKVNNFAEKRLGSEAFFPVTGDMPKEMEKAARILKMFTEEGVQTTEKKSKRKVLRKIPPEVIKNAKGLAIFTSMRSGIAPFGGAGGCGLVIARLPDGSWSAPSSITPNNLSAGFLLGVDIYDCVLVINTQKALDSFGWHKFTLGTEIGVAAGPYGAGAAVEAGKERSPVFSYVKSRGLYAGVEVVGQVFVERFDENGLMYHWPGIKASDILTGKVKPPPEAANLMKALEDAESGLAQQRTLNGQLDTELDQDGNPILNAATELELGEGEVLKLPPPPSATDGTEGFDDPETEEVIRRSGLNPPALPARRQVAVTSGGIPREFAGAAGAAAASPSLPSAAAVAEADTNASNAPLIPGIPPPLPPRQGEMPPRYEIPSAVDLTSSGQLGGDEFAAPDHPPPAHLLGSASAAPAALVVPPGTYADPVGPPPGWTGAAASGSGPITPPGVEGADRDPVSSTSPVLQTPVSPIATTTLAATAGAAASSAALAAVIAEEKREVKEYRPTTPDLMKIGAPCEMDDGERREWEQVWVASEMGRLKLEDAKAAKAEAAEASSADEGKSEAVKAKEAEAAAEKAKNQQRADESLL